MVFATPMSLSAIASSAIDACSPVASSTSISRTGGRGWTERASLISRSVSPDMWAERTEYLDVTFATINTMILVISSLWCQFGVWKAERGIPHRTGSILHIGNPLGSTGWGMREWYVLTYLFGATFIAGQVWEYATLTSEWVTPTADPYGSVFYITTGFHGLHVTGGLIAFLLIIGRSFTAKRYTHAQATGAVVTSYYWHFVDVVWIALFAAIYLLK